MNENELLRSRSAEKLSDRLFLVFTFFWFCLFLVLGPGVLLAAVPLYPGLYLVYISIGAYRLGKAIASWPTVEGEIITSEMIVEEREADEGYTWTAYLPKIVYRYTLDGRTYESDRVKVKGLSWLFGGNVFSEKEIWTARGILKNYPRGKKVPVHYHPDLRLIRQSAVKRWFKVPPKKSNSALEPGFPLSSTLIGVGCGLFLVALGLLILLIAITIFFEVTPSVDDVLHGAGHVAAVTGFCLLLAMGGCLVIIRYLTTDKKIYLDDELSLTPRPFVLGLLAGVVLFVVGWVFIEPSMVETVIFELETVVLLAGGSLVIIFTFVPLLFLTVGWEKEMRTLNDYGIDISPLKILLGFITGLVLLVFLGIPRLRG